MKQIKRIAMNAIKFERPQIRFISLAFTAPMETDNWVICGINN